MKEGRSQGGSEGLWILCYVMVRGYVRGSE